MTISAALWINQPSRRAIACPWGGAPDVSSTPFMVATSEKPQIGVYTSANRQPVRVGRRWHGGGVAALAPRRSVSNRGALTKGQCIGWLV